ncbi:hypothetical protein Poli38472_006756 [Pythium oligandrum]|uniref:RING-type domain-containing protein n=1 Tax=Pythium oligandrum TaxID=41045 RepID=A0A8K1FC31_PYTOL|nr:hypothetical protein Poli38472_006756 [Pythium oligandrum]|eukprot:TMW56746.1 hypothetical protein Poli38472_006756 [Pythium oligandrum]
MFLRTLYGSRMPQARHPRADEEISNYWRDDTESSREIARVMGEFDDDAGSDDDMKKTALPAVLADSMASRQSRSASTLALHPFLSHVLPSTPLEHLDTVNVEDMDAASISAQLSPSGLISIAAADIDEASRQDNGNVRTSGLDLELIQALRSAASTTDNQEEAPRRVLVENFMARMLPRTDTTTPSSVDQDSPESQLRFLSLLRRINELRSQQANVEADVWDGLPYPQIMALPTFKYQLRETSTDTSDEEASSPDDHKNNTMCAVCYTEYAPEEEVRALPCLHFYHRECIDQWLLHHRICPICKHIVAIY